MKTRLRRGLWGAGVGCALLVRSAWGDLAWGSKQVDLHPGLTESEATAEFRCTNTGPDEVVIESVIAGCCCLSASVDRKVLPVGESARFFARFKIGQASGVQAKNIYVKLRGAGEPTVLRMVTHLVELLEMKPSRLSWETGEEPRAKLIDVLVQPGVNLRPDRVLATDPRVQAQIRTVQEGRHYQIVVTPGSTLQPFSTQLVLGALVEDTVIKSFATTAEVRSRPGLKQGAYPHP